MKKPKKVELLWEDVNTNVGEAWHTAEDFPMPVRFNTIGYLVKEEVDYVVLSDTVPMSEDEGDWHGDQYGGLTAYPRSVIIDLKELS